ncbi:MAG TPA: hydroxyisourate hydrolase [Gemmatimonadota bacterium]|nr:hydroxyisourate hydrolase [Gemmatimonadota bacterium]
MSGITTHVLDTAHGAPAAGVGVLLAVRTGEGWRELDRAVTDAEGRVRAFPNAGSLEETTYRLRFETGEYFRALGVVVFWPHVEIAFDVQDPAEPHHVPLLLSPYGYATYRGS